jgi:hypothetical protein
MRSHISIQKKWFFFQDVFISFLFHCAEQEFLKLTLTHSLSLSHTHTLTLSGCLFVHISLHSYSCLEWSWVLGFFVQKMSFVFGKFLWRPFLRGKKVHWVGWVLQFFNKHFQFRETKFFIIPMFEGQIRDRVVADTNECQKTLPICLSLIFTHLRNKRGF